MIRFVFDRLLDFNDMSNRLGLFSAQRLENRFHYTFIFVFCLVLSLKFFFFFNTQSD